MATLQPIAFGLGLTQTPAGSRITVTRTGAADVGVPGSPTPIRVERLLGVRWFPIGATRIRFMCDGVCTVYADGDHTEHSTVGVGIDIPANTEIELSLEGGPVRELVPGFPLELEGLLLEPAVGAQLYVLGVP